MDLALFDFDGTITSADTFTPFVYFATSRAKQALGGLRLGPLIAGYKLGWVGAPRMRKALVRVAFRGRAEPDIALIGAHYAATRIPRVVRPNALERIQWHQERGDRVVVVSASLSAYLRPWCDAQGLDLICTELEAVGDRLTGEPVPCDCTGPEKARRVRERYTLTDYARVYAYGDTAEDEALLALADERYFRWQRS